LPVVDALPILHGLVIPASRETPTDRSLPEANILVARWGLVVLLDGVRGGVCPGQPGDLATAVSSQSRGASIQQVLLA
jgi:hypothetical protein